MFCGIYLREMVNLLFVHFKNLKYFYYLNTFGQHLISRYYSCCILQGLSFVRYFCKRGISTQSASTNLLAT